MPFQIILCAILTHDRNQHIANLQRGEQSLRPLPCKRRDNDLQNYQRVLHESKTSSMKNKFQNHPIACSYVKKTHIRLTLNTIIMKYLLSEAEFELAFSEKLTVVLHIELQYELNNDRWRVLSDLNARSVFKIIHGNDSKTWKGFRSIKINQSINQNIYSEYLLDLT